MEGVVIIVILGSGNQLPGLRIGRETQLQKPVTLRVQKLLHPSGEDHRLLNQHLILYAIGVPSTMSVRDLTRVWSRSGDMVSNRIESARSSGAYCQAPMT